MPLPPDKLVTALRDGGQRGGRTSAANKRERRRRYLAGEMGRVEQRDYELWVERLRTAARRGGWPSHKRNRVEVEAARGETATTTNGKCSDSG